MSVPAVSICLPVYNGERFLGAAIESVLAQTFSDFELLISDDASSDSSSEIINAYARRDDRIIVWSNPQNLGLFGNYNACMRRASGKYVKLFAQDDLFAPEMLNRTLEQFALGPNVAIVGTARVIIDDHVRQQPIAEQLNSSRIVSGNDLIDGCLVKLHNWIGEPSAVMFPTSLIGDGFDTSFFHLGDLEYWLRIVRDGDYVFLNEPLYSFRRHKASATDKNMRTLLCSLDMMRFAHIYRERLKRLEIVEDAYVRDIIDFSASYIHSVVREEDVSAQELASVAIGDSLDSSKLLTQFRELAIYALLALRETQLKAKSANDEIYNESCSIEEQLHRVLNSRTWRAAQALNLVGN